MFLAGILRSPWGALLASCALLAVSADMVPLRAQQDATVEELPSGNVELQESAAEEELPSGNVEAQESSAEEEQPVATVEQLQQQLQAQAERIEALEASREQADERLRGDLRSLTERFGSLEVESQQIASQFLESPSTESLRRTTGRLHLDYWAFPSTTEGINQIETDDPLDSPNDRFELRRIRIGVQGTVPPKNISYQLDLEFAGVDQIGIRDAWIGLDELPIFDTLRVGNQKRPYGMDQLNSSNFMVFAERPLMLDAVNEPNRRFGVQSYGASKDSRFNWRYGAFNLVPIDEAGFIATDNYQIELAGRMASTLCFNRSEAKYIHTGVSTSCGFPSPDVSKTTSRYRTRPETRSRRRWLNTDYIANSESSQLVGSELVLNYHALQVGSEFINVWLQRAGDETLYFHGGYVYVSYFLTGEFIRWNRQMGISGRIEPKCDFIRANKRSAQRGWGAWQLAFRASYADLVDSDILGGEGRSATLALNWYWNSHTRFQFNYVVGDIQQRAQDDGMGGMNILSGDYQITGARLMIDY